MIARALRHVLAVLVFGGIGAIGAGSLIWALDLAAEQAAGLNARAEQALIGATRATIHEGIAP